MIRRVTVLVAGMAMLATPALTAQETQGDGAEMHQRAPRAGMQQRGPRMQMGLDRMIGRLMDRQYELNLTDDQMEALSELRGDAQSSLAPLRVQMQEIHEGVSDGSMEREDAHNAMQGLHSQMAEAIEGLQSRLGEILDDEQRAALRQGRAQRARQGGRSLMHQHRGQFERQRDMKERQEQMRQRRQQLEEEEASVDS